MPLVALGDAGSATLPCASVLVVTRRSKVALVFDIVCFLVTGRALLVLLDDLRARLTNISKS